MNVLIGASIILSAGVWGYLSWWVYHDAERRRGDGWLWFTRVVLAGALLNIFGALAIAVLWVIDRNPKNLSSEESERR